jgi:glycosyltransferase involved in cell wall biosynthesis
VSVIEKDFTSNDYEIVVVDAGSTDRTPEIVRKFAPRVRLLSKKNGGQASAFNAALSELRGEIIAFLVGDDWFARMKLTAVMRVFEENPEAGGVAHGFYEFDEESNEARVRAPKSHNSLNLTAAAVFSSRFALYSYQLVPAVLNRRIPLSLRWTIRKSAMAIDRRALRNLARPALNGLRLTLARRWRSLKGPLESL